VAKSGVTITQNSRTRVFLNACDEARILSVTKIDNFRLPPPVEVLRYFTGSLFIQAEQNWNSWNCYGVELRNYCGDILLKRIATMAEVSRISAVVKIWKQHLRANPSVEGWNQLDAWLNELGLYLPGKDSAPISQLQHGYAITVHQAQGSTYKVVFVDAADIALTGKPTLKNRLLYTAATRPTDLLIINPWK